MRSAALISALMRIYKINILIIMETKRQEGMNNRVKIESNQWMRQINFPPSAPSESPERCQRISYESILQAIKNIVEIMKKPYDDNGINFYELQFQGTRILGIFFSHQSEKDEQSMKIKQMKEQMCNKNNSKINNVVDQILNVDLSPQDIESCAAQLLNFFEVNRFDYTPEELSAEFSEETILSTLNARRWKHSDFKRHLKNITKILLIYQTQFIQQLYKRERKSQREQFQTQFEEEISFLRQTFNNENQLLDIFLPGERETLTNRFIDSTPKNIPNILMTPERQRYLKTPKIIQKIKIQQEGQILIKIQQVNQILIKMEEIEK